MPSKESTLVRLPTPLVDRLDGARGEVARAAFLDVLLDAYERQEITAAPEPTTPKRTRKVDQAARAGGVTPSTCPHPRSRRIGDSCPLCGATGLK